MSLRNSLLFHDPPYPPRAGRWHVPERRRERAFVLFCCRKFPLPLTRAASVHSSPSAVVSLSQQNKVLSLCSGLSLARGPSTHEPKRRIAVCVKILPVDRLVSEGGGLTANRLSHSVIRKEDVTLWWDVITQESGHALGNTQDLPVSGVGD